MDENKNAKQAWFTFMSFIFCSSAVWGLLQAWYVGDPRFIAVALGAGFAMLTMYNRMEQHDTLCQPTVGISLETRENEQPQEVTIRPQIQSDNGHRIRYSKFNLTRKQWQSLATAFERENGRFTRDIVARANVFTNITSKWPGISREFERLGWMENGQLTDYGKSYFQQFLTPPPH